MEFTTAEYPCACCGNTTASTLVKKMGFNIVQCHQCKFVYVNPRIKNEVLGHLYEHNYFKNKDYGYTNYGQEKRLRVKNFERWLQDAGAWMPEAHQVNALDVGCAAGYCLNVMQSKGWAASGLELDEEVFADLIDLGKDVHRIRLENFSSQLPYQIITLFDVIEHIPDVDLAFKKLAALVADDGIIVMVTPDHDCLQRKLLGKRWFQYKPIEHIQYFTKQHLEVFARRNKLKLVYHHRCGQYADADFLVNRLAYYRFPLLAKTFSGLLRFLNLRRRFFYTDTGSRFAVFKKMQG